MMKLYAVTALASVGLSLSDNGMRMLDGNTGPNMTEYAEFKSAMKTIMDLQDKLEKLDVGMGGILSGPGIAVPEDMKFDWSGLSEAQNIVNQMGAIVEHMIGFPGMEAEVQKIESTLLKHFNGAKKIIDQMNGDEKMINGATQKATIVTLHPQFRSDILSMHHQKMQMPDMHFGHIEPMDVWDYEAPDLGSPSPCHADEILIQIEGVPGISCEPRCTTADMDCNYPTPPSMDSSVTQQCALQSPDGGDFCALICNPFDEDDGCPDGASCRTVLTTGICTYDIQ